MEFTISVKLKLMALDANKLKSLCESKNIFGESYSSVTSALNAAKNSENEDLILIGGSTFVVAEVL